MWIFKKIGLVFLQRMVSGNFFTWFWNRLLKELGLILSLITRFIFKWFCKVDPNKVFFMTQESLFTCNPKYISEELYKQRPKTTIVWRIPGKGDGAVPFYYETARLNSYEYFRELYSSKVIVANSFLFLGMPFFLKKNQVLIQTWHGSLGLKKHNKEVITDSHRRVFALNYTGKRTDYCIINSTLEQGSLKETYWPNTEMKFYGHARNDIMFPAFREKREELRRVIYKQYGIPDDAYIIMYAPTFRNSKSFEYYKIDYERVIDAVKQRFGGEWRLILRYHPSMRTLAEGLNKTLPKNVIDMTEYPDMQELVAITDIAITDYSSWIYDFVLSRKPGFLFATDIKEYTETDRGFYYPIETTPFAIAENNDQLVSAILAYNDEEYVEKVEAFLKDKGCIEDGHASERTAKLICDILDEACAGKKLAVHHKTGPGAEEEAEEDAGDQA